eukprot:scaffold33770_cov23-Prasinocladus_malaysianus.AAC.1
MQYIKHQASDPLKMKTREERDLNISTASSTLFASHTLSCSYPDYRTLCRKLPHITQGFSPIEAGLILFSAEHRHISVVIVVNDNIALLLVVYRKPH